VNYPELCKVRQVEPGTELTVGSFLTKNGAWNRKYRVVAITKQGERATNNGTVHITNYTVEIKFIGDFYASGDYKLAGKRTKSREFLVSVYDYHHGTIKPTLNAPAGYVHVELDL
jgi:hypothetical protein